MTPSSSSDSLFASRWSLLAPLGSSAGASSSSSSSSSAMLRETMGLAPSSAATDCVHRSASVGGLYAAFAAATQAATAGSIGSSSSSSFLADSSFLSFPSTFLSAAAAAATGLRASGNGSGASPGFSSTVPTHAYRPNTTQLSNQSSRFSLSLLLTLRVKYRVVLLRTMVPSSLSLPRAPYSMYSTGFWVSSLAREPILPSLRCASCRGVSGTQLCGREPEFSRPR